MHSYVGLYVHRDATGEILGVQVQFINGSENPMDPGDYVQKAIRPPIGELPDQNIYLKINTRADFGGN